MLLGKENWVFLQSQLKATIFEVFIYISKEQKWFEWVVYLKFHEFIVLFSL